MGKYYLPNGRKVFLLEFRFHQTYEGQLEGSPETVTPHILRGEQRKAEGKFRQVLEPQTPYKALPQWQVYTRLYSRTGVRSLDPDFASRLEVVWWVDSTDQSIDAMVNKILPLLDWETYAEDYSLMDF